MIQLTKLNGSQITLNAELIESIEATPDTILTLTNGKKIVVKENAEEIITKTIAYKKKIMSEFFLH